MGIFRPEADRLNKRDEMNRYLMHHSSIDDLGYLNFVSPIINYLKANFSRDELGLDYGCGHQPTLSGHLSKLGFQIKSYDPFFFDHKEFLKHSYAFIVCCEVIEHFHSPEREFLKLFNLLDQGGALVAMTHLFENEVEFSEWYYKNDATHVFIYTAQTLEWILENHGFRSLRIENRLIIFKK